ncbi:hypothetical protein Y032_0018g3592 [Ancylostoma ceylanicum]|uniref:Uncharacterized protein n=1 Tax=Ancylostoma ceylanicum TaxID=53326 RepID=A0A016V3Q6_9BILA|nr:hypothetical protein Y032_0018g3592 [Ancylostoma ceylanicum]
MSVSLGSGSPSYSTLEVRCRRAGTNSLSAPSPSESEEADRTPLTLTPDPETTLPLREAECCFRLQIGGISHRKKPCEQKLLKKRSFGLTREVQETRLADRNETYLVFCSGFQGTDMAEWGRCRTVGQWVKIPDPVMCIRFAFFYSFYVVEIKSKGLEHKTYPLTSHE